MPDEAVQHRDLLKLKQSESVLNSCMYRVHWALTYPLSKGDTCGSNINLCLHRLENMVVNLCLPHFHTAVHCNKLCADGYDVTNLVSADPGLRRRGFKLEYFLRPPVQVTLKFGFRVELCRVDIELWPWGMDHGQARKMLEISTSSDQGPFQSFGQRGHKNFLQKKNVKIKDQTGRNSEPRQEHESKSCHSNGHQWSVQAQQWGADAPAGSHRTRHEFTSQSNTDSNNPELEFKLVGRCELREETKVCFVHSNFRPNPLFPSKPPLPPTDCRQEELWSRGLFSLGGVTQLRVTVPFASAASALGLKALVVWGQPARCCPAEEVEKVRRVHEATERQPPRPRLFTSSVCRTEPPLEAAISSSNVSIPEEFLDPITQEVMMLPMLLPSGVSVDNTTLEEHQKREATWGRPPNDPFTGVAFTSTSQPLPNPQLKSRIDQFLLQEGMMGRNGMLGRKGEGENLQTSRLVTSRVGEQTQKSPCQSKGSPNSSVDNRNTNRTTSSKLERSSNNVYEASKCLASDSKPVLAQRNKRNPNRGVTEEGTSENHQLPQTKRQRNDALPSGSSHEQRLSASLDEALFSALQGRPSFTSNLSVLSKPSNAAAATPTGEKMCSACSCSVSAYSKPAPSIYQLTCSHLLCRSCLQRQSQPPNSITVSASNHISCPACQSRTPRSDITRVHL